MNIQKTFAASMRRYRKAAGLTQEQLAEKCGLHRTYIGGIEQCRINVSMKNIEKIATALGVGPAQLFASDDTPDSNAPASCAAAAVADASSRASALPRLGDESFALCDWSGDDPVLYPLHVRSKDITLQILTALVDKGFTGEELASEYDRIHTEVEMFLEGNLL